MNTCTYCRKEVHLSFPKGSLPFCNGKCATLYYHAVQKLKDDFWAEWEPSDHPALEPPLEEKARFYVDLQKIISAVQNGLSTK